MIVIEFPSKSAMLKGMVVLLFTGTVREGKGILGVKKYGAVFVTVICKLNLIVKIESLSQNSV